MAHAPLTASTTPSFVTSAAVPANGLLVVAGSYNTTNSAPTALTHCGTWTKGQDNANGGREATTWYCRADATGIATSTTVTLNQAASAVTVICAVSYPATVTTHDAAIGAGNSGSGTAIAWGPLTPSQSSEVIVATSNLTNAGALTDDSNYTLLCDEGATGVENYTSERVITSTAATSYSATYSVSGPYATGADAFAYSTGGGAASRSLSLLGVGQ